MVDSTIYAEPTPIVPVAVRGIIVDIEGKDAIKRPEVAATPTIEYSFARVKPGTVVTVCGYGFFT